MKDTDQANNAPTVMGKKNIKATRGNGYKNKGCFGRSEKSKK